jgi:hypothetical protein
MNLTLAAAKSALARFIAPGLDTTQIINNACERLINGGRWKGTQDHLVFQVNHTGLLTLPRQYMTVLGIKVDAYARQLANQWYELLPGTGDRSQLSSYVRDEGDGYCIFGDVGSFGPVALKAVCEGFDPEQHTIRVQGIDEEGQEIFDSNGERGVELTFNGAASAVLFTQITGVIKPPTNAIAKLVSASSNGEQWVIGLYEPGELRPCYRRYFVPEAAGARGLKSVMVTALCQRRHVEATHPNDLLFTANIGALQNAVLGLHYEEHGDGSRAEYHFNKAVSLLNDELKRFRPPSELGTVRINAFGGFGSEGLKQSL